MKESGAGAMVMMAIVCLSSCQTPSSRPAADSPVMADAPQMPRTVEKEEGSRDSPPATPTPVVEVPSPAEEPGEITSMDIEQFFMMKGEGKTLVVDVRPSFFYSMGHIGDAISLPLKSFEPSFKKNKPLLDAALAEKKVIVLYCANVKCPDGYAVAKKLAAKGYSCSLYKGGWEEWKAAGLE